MRATFVYPNPRRSLAQAVSRNEAPDSQLLGQNHLGEHGIAARIHDSHVPTALSPPALARAAWLVRELVLPIEIGVTDVVVTGLATLFPLAAQPRRFRTVVVNYGLNQIDRRGGRTRRGLLRSSLRAADLVVCFGDSQREELEERGLLAADRLSTLPFGVDARWFSPGPQPQGRSVVLAVGKDLGRDFGTFASAIRGLDADVEVIALPRNVRGLTLPPNARVLQVSIVELRERYARADCVVIPQFGDEYNYGADGGLTVLLEAMAMGRPIVATDRALIREYVEREVEAILVPPGDSTALRRAVEDLLGDPARAKSIGAAARKRVERDFTSSAFAARLAPLLRSVV